MRGGLRGNERKAQEGRGGREGGLACTGRVLCISEVHAALVSLLLIFIQSIIECFRSFKHSSSEGLGEEEEEKEEKKREQE